MGAQFSPWMLSMAYPLGRRVVMPFYFKHITITGQENLPRSGPVILAPTHRSRWDALLIPYAAGREVTGRDLRFMVSANEVRGLQGWLISHMGGFPIDTRQPGIASLRYGVELLQNGEALVIFPEGGIYRDNQMHRLKPGLARLALQAEANHPDLGTQIVPIHLTYSDPFVPWRSRVKIDIGTPLEVAKYDSGTPKCSAQKLTFDLESSLKRMAGEERAMRYAS
ncbi:MAG: 1-acyl-sn-glycerol-3-phosphate acyltransferase [Scytolyngbya sp. HA4215-MV1]|nr:1-acyl-sn-glycerol-3-phosphate acyltransferase [Scytolyngbya sp. HA4215-MV1]